jgi:hypothetical protein
MSRVIKKYCRRETIALAIFGCTVIAIAVLFLNGAIGTAAGPKPKLDKLTLSCDSSTPTSITIKVTAGASGAPAGFSIQWMKLSDFVANNNSWPSDSDCPLDVNGNPTCPASFCKASLSGVPGCSNYNLTPGQSTLVQIGDNLFDDCGASSTCANEPLECNTQYIFRAFAHNVPGGLARSDFSANQVCSTAPCGGGDTDCTFTQGYWKQHGPGDCSGGNNTNVWPVTSLIVGNHVYTDAELCSILNQPAAGNGLLTLAHQLIAAKLNIAKGADGTSINATIAAADALIGSNIIPPVGSDSLTPGSVSALVTALTNFNEGATGPGHCPSEKL